MAEVAEQDSDSKLEASSFLRGEERILSDIAGDSGFTFKRGSQWSINPETGQATYDPKFFEDKGYSRAQAVFAAFHEIKCHFVETADLLASEQGEKAYQSLKRRTIKNPRVKLWENYRTDIKGNRAILNFAPALSREVETLYKDKLFPVTDFTASPSHLQLIDAIIRKSMVPGVEVKVSPEVEEAIKKLRNIKGRDVIDLATDPDQDPLLALRLSQAFIEPVIEELYQKDLEDKKNKNNQKQKGDKKESQGTDNQGQQQESGQSGESKDQDKKDGKSKEEPADNSNSTKSQGGEQTQQDENESGEPFRQEYEKREEEHPSQMNKEDIEKKIKQRNEALDQSEREKRGYEKEHGVSKEDIDDYNREYKKVEPYIQQLRDVFVKIVQERKILKRRLGSLKEEGVMLDPGLVAQTYMDVKAGRENPKTMKDFEGYLLPDNIPSDFSLHLVADQSGSMGDSDKDVAQRQAAILIMEALREFSELAEDEEAGLIESLNIQTELRSFGVSEGTRIYKPLSKELSEQQRVSYFKGLLQTTGGTNDYDVLEEIFNETNEKIKSDSDYGKKLKSGKLREIVVVLSDGESGSYDLVRKNLDKLRNLGVKAIGVGITEEGEAILETYAPDAKVCQKVSMLPPVMTDLLNEYLSEFSIGNLRDVLKSE